MNSITTFISSTHKRLAVGFQTSASASNHRRRSEAQTLNGPILSGPNRIVSRFYIFGRARSFNEVHCWAAGMRTSRRLLPDATSASGRPAVGPIWLLSNGQTLTRIWLPDLASASDRADWPPIELDPRRRRRLQLLSYPCGIRTVDSTASEPITSSNSTLSTCLS